MTKRFVALCGRWCVPAAVALVAPMVATATLLGADPAPAAVPDAAPTDSNEFLRFVEDGKGGGRLEAAVVTYKDKQGRTVDLISALHVGEKAYYEALSKSFPQYDALLYEMVKSKDADVPRPGQKAGGAVSGFQRFLKGVLELEFQLDAIDYTAKNFVHADLDYEEFEQKQEERGESMLTLMLHSMIAELNRQASGQGGQPITLIDILTAMSSPDSARQYKLLLARQFGDIEAQMAGLEGPDGSVIVTERNKAALNVLAEQLRAGKQNLGIFYGAGHMSGMEKTLTDEMGFKRVGERWLTAWDMTAKPDDAAKKPAMLPVAPANQ